MTLAAPDEEAAPSEGQAPNERQAQSLCVGCGLCCNGSIFANVPARREELPRIRAAGVPADEANGAPRFHLPCPQLQGARCGIYEQRFSGCRAFRCALLVRLDTGRVTVAEAEAEVDKAKGLLARIAALEPGAVIAAARIELRASGAAPPPGASPAELRLWVEAMALDNYFDRVFRNRKMLMDETPAAGETAT